MGRDIRLSSPEIFEYLCKGITDSGASVHDLGLSTTPLVYWVTAKYNYKASVMITASHNAKEYNGLKISKENALPVGFDSGLNLLQQWVETEAIEPSLSKGSIHTVDYKNEYITFQKQFLTDLSNLKIAIDCSNGMCNLFVKELFGDQVFYLFDKLDGNFPNHEPNPLEPENIKDLQSFVRKEKCDAGVIYDGDADRVMFVDEHGDFVSPDLFIAVMADYFCKEKGLTGNVLQDIRTSKSVQEHLEKLGNTVYTWRVGRAYAARKLREIDGIFGGELAGHYYFRDFFYSDSGIMASLIILGIISKSKTQGQSLSEIIAQIKSYYNTGEVNFRLERKTEAMEAVKAHFEAQEKPLKVMDFDGYRIEFADWWFNIRMSNTEPYLRFIAEAKTQAMLDAKLKEAQQIIASFS